MHFFDFLCNMHVIDLFMKKKKKIIKACLFFKELICNNLYVVLKLE